MNRRSVVLGTLAVLLTGTLVAGSVLAGAERTVLDADYVTDRIASENQYEEVRAPFAATMRDRLAESGDSIMADAPSGIEIRAFDREAIAHAAVTEAFGPTRIDRTIERIYGYLHGRRGHEALTVSLQKVSNAYAARVAEAAIRIDVAAVAGVGGDLPGPLDIDPSTVRRLRANESSYRATRAAFRASLSPGTDPETLGERAKAILESRIAAATAEYEPAVTEAVTKVQFATVDALTGTLSYEAYISRLEAATTQLETVAGERIRERVEERAPDSITLGAKDAPFQHIDERASTVRLIDLLVWVLPVVALVLVTIIYWVSRSMWTTARTTGGALLGAGVVPLLTTALARDAIVARASDAVATGNGGIGALVAPLSEGFLDVLLFQSLLVALCGIVLLGIVWIDKRGHFDRVRVALGRDPAPVDAGESAGESTTDTDADGEVPDDAARQDDETDDDSVDGSG